MLALNSFLHFIIDGICAYAMFGTFAGKGAEGYLFYNLLAFALQMPIGALTDLVSARLGKNGYAMTKRFHFIITLLGVVFTIIGIFAGPLSLGVGNALFHVGGGVSSIREDDERGYGGRGLGIFVAPGALGLFVGSILAPFSVLRIYIISAFIILSLLGVIGLLLRLFYEEKHLSFVELPSLSEKQVKTDGLSEIIISAVICFIVVIIRSYTSLSVSFDWKIGALMGLFATLAVVLGKAAGGFLAYYLGNLKATVISLSLAAVCFVFSDKAVFGILALFFFNMTMPITLYILVREMRKCPGFAFGLLTFALFIGFVTVYYGLRSPDIGKIVGCAGSVISLLLMLLQIFCSRRKK